MGTEEGLFSFKLSTPNAQPVKIEGISKVFQMALAPQIGVDLMIVEKERRLVMCDHRALISNAEAAACSNPSISVRPIEKNLEKESCIMFAISPPNADKEVFVTVATHNKLL